MSERQEQNTGLCNVREAHRFDVERLAAYLTSRLEGFRAPLSIRQFKGGQSNPTYLLDAQSGQYVLRRKPPGKLLQSAHAVDREFRIIGALHATGFPVPRPYLLCEDDDVIGTMFFVMEFVAGRVFWDLDLPDLSRATRAKVYNDTNDTIARLHNLDHSALGLADYGKPGNYFSRQISRWSRQYRASETGVVDAMNALIRWLPENIPADESITIVHGDYRLDNMILHPTEPKVLAVLDWELSTLGHPLADFTYHLMSWQMPKIGVGSKGLLGMPLAELGIPDEEAYIERYCRQTGRSGGIPDRNFYSAFNFFRLAAILQGIAGRVRDGTASSDHAELAVQSVRPLAEIGLKYMDES